MKRYFSVFLFIGLCITLLSSCRSKEKCPSYSKVNQPTEIKV